MNNLSIILLLMIGMTACSQSKLGTVRTPSYKATNQKTELTCNLLPEELLIRKATVLESLKQKVEDKRELPNGYAFKFPGDDAVVDELIEFIKTERQCCDFFVFNLSISGDKSEAWLELTGTKGAKDFITEELGL